jgi:zinc finger/BTB domain-containing protein 24
MAIHTGMKKHKCEVCDEALSTGHSLIRHMTVHTGDKSHKCEVCYKVLTTQRNHKEM